MANYKRRDRAGDNEVCYAAGSGTDQEPLVPAYAGITEPSSVLFTRPANTTAYAVDDVVNIAALTVSGATNASPIVVTTSGAHGLTTDQAVIISGVGGNTAANGCFIVEVLSSTTFSLHDVAGDPVAGNGAYTSGGSVGLLLQFEDMARVAGHNGYITAASLKTDNVTQTNFNFRLFLYKGLPTGLDAADNAQFPLLWANRALEVGYIDFTAPVVGGTGTDYATCLVTNVNMPYTCEGKDLFGVLTTKGAYVPESGQQFSVALTAEKN